MRHRLLTGAVLALWFAPLPNAHAGEITGKEPARFSLTIVVSKAAHLGRSTGTPMVQKQSGTLRDCFEFLRYRMHSVYSEWARKDGTESITAYCIYENEGGALEEYIAGIWTDDGRYEPKFPDPKMKYPEWER
jgi:hypothetical protein